MNPTKEKGPEADRRIKAKHVSWVTFLATYAVLAILTCGQALIFGSLMPMGNVPIRQILGAAGYWASRSAS